MEEEVKTQIDSTKIDLEQTPEFQAWKKSKIEECVLYLKTAFREDVSPDKLTMRLFELGFPDPLAQQRAHAQIWGYNYKDSSGEILANPANGMKMSYTVWKDIRPDTDSGTQDVAVPGNTYP